MAELVNVTSLLHDELINATTTNNETSAAVNGTKSAGSRIPATPEGAALAYASLILMAVLPIFMGAYRSVKHHHEMKKSGEKTDTLTRKDAAMFPIIASGALLALYIFFQVFSKEYINMLLTGYFFFLGVLALAHILSPVFVRLTPKSLPTNKYHLHFTQGENKATEDVINYKFDNRDIVCFVFSLIFGVWYLWKKHWIANNLFGLAFAINGVELLHLNNIVTGCILLGGLFFYDIFWVFGTDVMVTVAKSFEAPIKLVFPQDLLEKGLEANNFAMLGLGDIVIPGIFIALLLRFDVSRKVKGAGGSNTYFNVGFVAYIAGLLATIFVMHVFKHAQPALLYLVPACLGLPLLVALLKGDLKAIFNYEDNPPEAEVPAVKGKGKTQKQLTKKDK